MRFWFVYGVTEPVRLSFGGDVGLFGDKQSKEFVFWRRCWVDYETNSPRRFDFGGEVGSITR
ncbi:hypothetical protein BSG1_05475 [Bacillus sp. SG-1]|nr:hypothetical protein BSG1_05475 [Bacillus sp. SG-1]